MTHKSDEASKLVENQQLSAVLAQMSEADLTRLLNSIEALQIDLSQLVPLLNGAEPIRAITATQDLLKILNNEINGIFAARQPKDSRGGLQNWDNEGGNVDYTPVYHLLRKVSSGKACLIWADIGQVH
jgi:hypothetical protein